MQSLFFLLCEFRNIFHVTFQGEGAGGRVEKFEGGIGQAARTARGNHQVDKIFV